MSRATATLRTAGLTSNVPVHGAGAPRQDGQAPPAARQRRLVQGVVNKLHVRQPIPAAGVGVCGCYRGPPAGMSQARRGQLACWGELRGFSAVASTPSAVRALHQAGLQAAASIPHSPPAEDACKEKEGP